jgi:hypothetical protein
MVFLNLRSGSKAGLLFHSKRASRCKARARFRAESRNRTRGRGNRRRYLEEGDKEWICRLAKNHSVLGSVR